MYVGKVKMPFCISRRAVMYLIYGETEAEKGDISRYTTHVHEQGRILDFFLKTAKTIEKQAKIP